MLGILLTSTLLLFPILHLQNNQSIIVVAIRFFWRVNSDGFSYLHVLVGMLTATLAFVMLCVSLEMPKPVIDRLEKSRLGETLFTFRGRYVVDIIIVLFLLAMNALGMLLAVLTISLIYGIRVVGVRQPDAFNEIFRQPNEADSYALESEYDTPVVEKA